jgi:hypothetical protein|tara:strand:+ start:8850 stop:11873 length:3024 start_codon:yes stop_codon:yes gene_type:complete
MTVSSTTKRNSYTGNGSTTTFAYSFKIFDDDDITVILRTTATGTETVQTKTTHYSVTGVGNSSGGNVVFGSAPTSAQTVVLLRQTAQTQATDYTPNDPFPAASHEDALDKLTLMTQDQQDELDRSIKLSRTNTMTSTEFTVTATNRANKIFAFDSSGELSVTQEIGTFRGDWAASTSYAVRDLVKDTSTNNIFIVNEAHTSSGSQPLTTNANSAKYDLIVDAAAATTSASAAASSATAAASSASTASTQASNASSSASTASTQASNAASSATAAASSATAAAASATSAATALDNFDDIFLGAKSSDPSTDNDGDALTTGDIYFNTSSNTLRVFNGSSFQDASISTTATTAELNIMDGDTSASSTTVADADRVVFNDAGTMKQVAVTDLAAYFDDEITAMPNLVTTGALNSGSITSGFGAIDNGSSNITTTGVGTFGSLDISGDIDVDGTTNLDVVDIDGAVDMASTLQVDGAITSSAGATITTADNTAQLTLKSTDADAGVGPVLELVRDSGSPADSDLLGTINFIADDDAGNASTFASISTQIGDASNGTESCGLQIKAMSGGSLVSRADFLVSETIFNNGSIDLDFRVESNGNANMLFVDAGNDKAGIGTNSPSTALDVEGAGVPFSINSNNSNQYKIQLEDAGTVRSYLGASSTASFVVADSSVSEAMRITSGGLVAIGNSTPDSFNANARNLVVGTGSGSNGISIFAGNSSDSAIFFADNGSTATGQINYKHADNAFTFHTNGGNERMRISDDDILFGTTSTSLSDAGIKFANTSATHKYAVFTHTASSANESLLYINRQSSDGTLIDFRKANATSGTIGTISGDIFIANAVDVGLYLESTTTDHIAPCDASGSKRDDAIDLGASSARFDDVFATNGTIQTSDENEKQNIAALTSAEITAAKAISKLFKTFKWKSKVTAKEEKGETARTHTGVIAQEVQTAMSDAGLDASKYAFWCSDTWTNDDGNQQTRMGVRYPELLAFVGAATEQRLADIEKRLTALESS